MMTFKYNNMKNKILCAIMLAVICCLSSCDDKSMAKSTVEKYVSLMQDGKWDDDIDNYLEGQIAEYFSAEMALRNTFGKSLSYYKNFDKVLEADYWPGYENVMLVSAKRINGSIFSFVLCDDGYGWKIYYSEDSDLIAQKDGLTDLALKMIGLL